MIETQVLVVGGGATGVGVARDAALRGLSVVLVERRDLAEGTTGRFHGLLHSGGRYAVKDPHSARECIDENRILRRIAAHCIEDTGGLFVCAPADDAEFGDRFRTGCVDCRHPGRGDRPGRGAAARAAPEPRHCSGRSPCPTARSTRGSSSAPAPRTSRRHGGTVLTYHDVVAVIVEGDGVCGAHVRDTRTGEQTEVRAQMTVSATGAWAGQLAAMAGCTVHVRGGRGVMVALNHRLAHAVLNRCRIPADSDILVPAHTVSVIGTTDTPVDDPDDHSIPASDVRKLLDEGSELVPHLREARALRAWAGLRPLYSEHQTGTATRHMSRGFTLLDHREREGVAGFLTITGGKLTTFRRMAEVTVDAVCEHLGVEAACRTADEILPGSEDGHMQHRRRAAGRARGQPARRAGDRVRVRARHPRDAARRGRRPPDAEPRRPAPGPAARDGAVPGRLLHPARSRHARGAPATWTQRPRTRRCGRSSRSGGRAYWPILDGRQARQTRLDEWMFHGLSTSTTSPHDRGRRMSRVLVVGAGLAGLAWPCGWPTRAPP